MASSLLEKKIIACANIFDSVTSAYRWEGRVQQETEAVMIVKTSGKQKANVMHFIQAGHSYKLPCITAYKVADGLPDFLSWVAAESAGA